MTTTTPNPDREIVRWARQRAEEAGPHSVSRLSGPDVLRLCALAEWALDEADA